MNTTDKMVRMQYFAARRRQRRHIQMSVRAASAYHSHRQYVDERRLRHAAMPALLYETSHSHMNWRYVVFAAR